MIDIICIIYGIMFWYLYFGFECFLNGSHGNLSMPFKEWYRELKWNLPFVGFRFRLQDSAGDYEWAKQFPGPIHFIIVCIILPLSPWLLLQLIRTTI